MRVVVAAATDVGLVRANNEDSFLVDDEHGCYAVADGMGGHRGGEVASATAIEALRAEIARGSALDAAIAIANDAVLTKAAADPELAGMGTTLTGVVVTGDTVTIGHVGDSRAYLIRDGALRMLTDDHSLVGEWIRAGRLTVEQAEVHPQRSVITRCLGSSIDVAVDVITLTPAAGDRLVLCSDGLTTMLRDPAILDIAGTDDEPAEVARRLVAAACGAGGDDNVTVVVLDVEDVGVGIPTTPTAAAAAPPDRSVADPPAVAPSPALVTPSRNRRRSALLLLAPVLVIAVAVGVLGWYARRSYFIGERAGVVVIFQGVPGGVIGWNPTLREETDPPLRVDALRPDQQLRVADNSSRGSLAALRSTVDAWRSDADARSTTTTTSTTTTLARGQRPTSTTVRRVPPIQP